MKRTTIALLGGFLLALGTSTVADAELLISIGNASVNPLGFATLDVTIGTTDTTPVSIDSFAFTLVITPANGTQTQLAFAMDQPQPYSNSNYVFAGDSLNQSAPVRPDDLGFVTQSTTPNDTYIGGDSTPDYVSKSVVGGKLLFQVEVEANTSALPMIGDSFTVSLVSSASRLGGSANSPTYFTTNSESTYLPYTSTSGTVTILAVPEPSSIVLVGTAGMIVLVVSRSRRTRRAGS